ncbi:WAT1-related protein At1g09380-like [Camellia sinensis]|uniref:WAT1-related protein At1g09380-like n=1 Tax=Camellia sinensis TaxID=4442 RepID=UPI0010363E1A|nr:WAT1-related protein At1g09380-like [Camellia sinensis]
MEGDMLPFLAMVIVQVGYAGMNILSKLAMDSGMNPFVHVAYRQIFASIVIAPFAYFLERKTRPRMTLPIFFQIFLCSIFGATLNQVLYFVGLYNSTPTIACALSNLLPAATFILAIPFGLESVGMKRKAGQAKILGTVVCVGGAMLLSFYHGHAVIGESSIHWKYADDMGKENSTNHHQSNSFILGPFLVMASTVSWAVWFIIQAKMSEKYAAPYTTSALICLMASIECGIIALCADRNISAWSLSPPGIRLFSSLYAGTVCTAAAFCLMSWCIQRKGPLYVSVFSPLLLIIVAILSWALLEEKLYIGTAVGSGLIVMGLYAVLWGKNGEINVKSNSELSNLEEEEEKQEAVKNDLEMHFSGLSNGDFHSIRT